MSTIKLMIDGFNYALPNTCLEVNGSIKRICLRAKNVANMLKQYINKNYPDFSCWATSDEYSGGSSVRVYVSLKDGQNIPLSIKYKLDEIGNKFSAGTFDGMTDSYNYNSDTVSDFGTQVTFYPKYVFIENHPKYGTIEYYMNLAQTHQVSFKEILYGDNFISNEQKETLFNKYLKLKTQKKWQA